MKNLLISAIIYIIFGFTYGDNLYLNGIVKKTSGNTVVIDVLSHSCKGEKKFKLSPEVNISKLKIGERIYFLINSSSCDKEEIYIDEVD